MTLKQLKKREQQLRKAHAKLSEQIEALLDHRIRMAGAIQENLFMQKQLEKKTPEDKARE